MPADKMNRDQIDALLNRAYYARLSTMGEKYPYTVPLCYLYHEGKLYFHSRLTGKKMSELTAKPEVCLQIDEIKDLITSSSPCDFNVAYESVIVQGTTAVIDDFGAKGEILLLLAQKYAKGQPLDQMEVDSIKGTALVQVNIETISGKAKKA